MVEAGLHIVVFPWLAFGHMMPFVELSRSLARRGHRVSFISTPRNIERLPKIPAELSHLIHFVSFPLPPVDGLPATAEATSDILYDEIPFLKAAFDRLELPFAEFIKSDSHPKPDWIIQDFAPYWIPKIAAEAGTQSIFFSVFSAATMAFFKPTPHVVESHVRRTPEEFTVPAPWVSFPTKVFLRLREAQRLFAKVIKANASGVPDSERYLITVAGCSAMAVRSSMELEPEWVRLLQELLGEKPLIPVGLLPPPPPPEKRGDGDEKILEWLDKQTRPRSVVYVAFGSEAMLSEEEVKRVAEGLELANLPFLWSLRMPDRSELNKEEILPEGFEERTKDYGIVIKGWIPQLKVLAHESIGGFFFHAGWSSVIEALQFGLPFLYFPKSLDNPIIARTLEEQGIGVELERSEEEGPFTGEGLAKYLKLIMVEEEGEPYRKKAREMKVAFADKECHEKYMDDFVDLLQSHRLNRKG